MMNILISHVYSTDNKGDAALLSVLIQELQKQFVGATIVILTMDQITGSHSTFDDISLKPSFMYFTRALRTNKLLSTVYGLSMTAYTLWWALARRYLRISLPISSRWRETIDYYIAADLVVPVGGGYLRTKPQLGSLYDFMLLLHPLILSKLLGKPTVLYSQSVGPLYRSLDRRMLATTLNHAVTLTLAREDKSMNLLQSIGVKNCVRSVDAGFLLKSQKASKRVAIARPTGKTIVGVTARQWLDGDKQVAYEQAMTSTLDYLVQKHNAYIVFIPQVTSEYHGDDDRTVNKAVHSNMRYKEQALLLTENYGYREVKALYDQLDFLLGTRFHSVIFSLTSYVPALAIEYEHKTSGIMHDLGLDKWVVKMEDVTPEVLKTRMAKLLREQAPYKKHLHHVLPPYIEKAHQAIKLVAQAYQSNYNLE